MAFVSIVVAVTFLNLASAYPHSPCPAPLPEIVPVIVKSVLPAPINIGPAAPGVIEHASAPYEINYFEKPWIIKHKQSAALNVFTQTPVVVDEYAAPTFNEAPAPPAVIVEEVCGAPLPVNPAPALGNSAVVPAPGHGAAPAPCY